jgi:hypothetical protein
MNYFSSSMLPERDRALEYGYICETLRDNAQVPERPANHQNDQLNLNRALAGMNDPMVPIHEANYNA